LLAFIAGLLLPSSARAVLHAFPTALQNECGSQRFAAEGSSSVKPVKSIETVNTPLASFGLAGVVSQDGCG
jgi:hypothetical protein